MNQAMAATLYCFGTHDACAQHESDRRHRADENVLSMKHCDHVLWISLNARSRVVRNRYAKEEEGAWYGDTFS